MPRVFIERASGSVREICFRDLAVGFRSQGEDHLGGVDGAVDTRPALADAALDHAMVEVADQLHLFIDVPPLI